MIRMFGMCFNPKVLAGLGAVGLGVFVFVSPGAAVRALPVLVGLACPLSMLLMMGGMGAAMKPKADAPASTMNPADHDAEIAALRSRLETLERAEGRTA